MATTVKIEKVTPAKAAEFLKMNTANRHLKLRDIQQMVSDMQTGRFVLNGESIKLGAMNGGPDDVLIDGQNRCEAIVRSGVTVETVVVRGLAYQPVIATVDSGAKRTMGDLLKLLKHEKNYAALAATTGWAYRQEHRKGKDRGFIGSHLDLLDYLDANPQLRDATELALATKRGFTLTKASVLGAALFHGLRLDATATTLFAERMGTGENLIAKQPAYVLRDWLTKAAAAARTPVVDAYPAVTNKALIAELEGREIARLHYKAGEAFPYVQDAEIIEA